MGPNHGAVRKEGGRDSIVGVQQYQEALKDQTDVRCTTFLETIFNLPLSSVVLGTRGDLHDTSLLPFVLTCFLFCFRDL